MFQNVQTGKGQACITPIENIEGTTLARTTVIRKNWKQAFVMPFGGLVRLLI